MRGFDFESEAAIRLSWRGVPVVNVPTPVRYFRREDGGVSHFNYLRDNILLVFMYARLLVVLPTPPARHIGAAARQNIAPLIDMICAEI